MPYPKIIIPGGAGYLGRYLAAHFAAQGYAVGVLTRRPQPNHETVRYVAWDGATRGAWAAELEGAAAVINLAGRSVNCRYNAQNRQAIYASRLDSTRVLGDAIAACEQPPRVWLNASSATIYRHALDRPMDEASGEIGSGFSVDVCQQWERVFFESATPHTRKAALRTAIVLGKGRGGAMEPFRNLARLGLGGAMAGGKQYVSWIHIEDFARAVQWIVEHDELSGPINVAAPMPRTNADFMRVLRLACKQPLGIPSARWMLEVGAFMLRTETELLLKSRRVVPARLLQSGFAFHYPQLYDALRAIVTADHPMA
jgi:uncharacterized protein (TIGR01777 family)